MKVLGIGAGDELFVTVAMNKQEAEWVAGAVLSAGVDFRKHDKARSDFFTDLYSQIATTLKMGAQK